MEVGRFQKGKTVKLASLDYNLTLPPTTHTDTTPPSSLAKHTHTLGHSHTQTETIAHADTHVMSFTAIVSVTASIILVNTQLIHQFFCLPPRRRSYLVLLRADITLSGREPFLLLRAGEIEPQPPVSALHCGLVHHLHPQNARPQND